MADLALLIQFMHWHVQYRDSQLDEIVLQLCFSCSSYLKLKATIDPRFSRNTKFGSLMLFSTLASVNWCWSFAVAVDSAAVVAVEIAQKGFSEDFEERDQKGRKKRIIRIVWIDRSTKRRHRCLQLVIVT
ncbi:conserved hypothetical protein [Trichinella spiralis]|uniref:hypothetical protein n=1 Tax=Trichinella spiralis TaxID=6334 RepID=UPI0001EFC2F2|nr:conserved hypothetical protein [Trichinella spiralis]